MSGRTGGRWLLLYNAAAGQRNRRSQIEQVRKDLAGRGIELETFAPSSPAEMTERAKSAANEGGVSAVLAMGGDGTIATVAAGLVGTATPLGIVPAGTANVLAREISIPLDPVEAVRVLVDATPRPFDVGRANGRLFLLMAGVGIDAEIVRDAPRWAKRHFGRAGFLGTTLAKVFRNDRPRVVVEIGGVSIEAADVVVANCRLYGGAFAIAPEADPADGMLDVVIFENSGPRDLFRSLIALVRGRHLDLPGVSLRRADRIRIRAAGASGAGAVQLDGDYVSETPVEITVEARALHLLVPPNR